MDTKKKKGNKKAAEKNSKNVALIYCLLSTVCSQYRFIGIFLTPISICD